MKDYRKSLKLFSDQDEAWQFLWDLDKDKYEIVDYGTLDNMGDMCYYVLYRKKNNDNN